MSSIYGFKQNVKVIIVSVLQLMNGYSPNSPEQLLYYGFRHNTLELPMQSFPKRT